MTDNVTLPGTGAVIAAENVSSVEYQRVKLIDSTASATAPIGVAANPLIVGLGTDLDSVNDSIMPYAHPANFLSGVTAAITDTNVAQIIVAQAGGIRIYVTSIFVTNSHATVGTVVEIRDGTSTVLWRGYAAPAGGGFFCHFPTPLVGTAATALNAYNITNGSNTYVCATGFKGA